ncbi:hypothetical protein J2Y48_004881 [Mycoplana sp. BE70]|uniref:cache domain-containing protein n=1 Tax=Mycoplana sp. BE70 TaxID=2817775 RepID=UPI002857C094|nr:cache domain-containing protein [Mycoplana sp. BE70]MDR6759565.1 hypothetical protein [Mycoplana sp. BE70]
MADSERRPSAPSLATVTIAFVLVSGLIGLAIAYEVISDRARAFEQASLTRAVETRVKGVQVALAQALYREWGNLTSVRRTLSPGNPARTKDQLSTLAGEGTVISWAGFSNSEGQVVAASNDLLLGADASSRPWFQRGLQGDFAGDVHESVLLASKLPPAADGRPPSLLDLAAPIAGPDGTVAGVLSLHLNFDWAQTLVEELAEAMNLELFVVNPEGRAVLASDGGNYADLDIPSFRMARAGASGVNVETWPDGKLYFTATVPELAYRGLPKFGWNIIARIDADAVIRPAQAMSNEVLVNLMLFGLLLVLLTLLFIVAYIRPFRALAGNASAIAQGEDVYPYESGRTSELSTIGAALARLQGYARSTSEEEGSFEQVGRARPSDG